MGYPPLADLYQLRYLYQIDVSGQVVDHVFQYWAAPQTALQPIGTPAASVDLLTFNATPRTFADEAVDMVAVLQGLCDASLSVIDVELWAYSSGSQVGSYITSASITATGTDPLPPRPAGQVIFTARTFGGRIAKAVFMEGKNTNNLPTPWAVGTATFQGELGDLMVDNANRVAVDRGGDFWFSALRQFPGESEAIFKKRFRP